MIGFVAFFGLAAWLYLYFAHSGFWRADQRLPAKPEPVRDWPTVVAIVPARNEADSIGAMTTALLAQDYRGALRIIVVDDASTDGTADLARAYITGSSPNKLDVITGQPLVPGWTGKLWALNSGLRHAEAMPHDYIWFTDADIVHPPETLTRLVSKAVNDKRDLVSLMVRLRCVSFWEHRLVPAFIFFFQMLYPFAAANDDRARTAAAAGGCVLLARGALRNAGGLAVISDRVIDDCALASIIKRSGGRIWLGLAGASYSLRAADTLGPLWSMVRRTAFTQLYYSRALLLGTLMGLGLVFAGPTLVVLSSPWHQHILATLAGLAAWALMAKAYAPTLRDYGRSPWEGWLLPFSAALYAAMTVDSAVAHWQRRGGQWKGRHYGPS